METVFFILFAIPLVLWGLGGVEGGKIEKKRRGPFPGGPRRQCIALNSRKFRLHPYSLVCFLLLVPSVIIVLDLARPFRLASLPLASLPGVVGTGFLPAGSILLQTVSACLL